jgi:hypothetical protein
LKIEGKKFNKKRMSEFEIEERVAKAEKILN